MIQPARKNNSKSFLREAEIAIFAIKDDKARNYFLKKLKEVFEKRKNPNCTLTGEKALKTEILAYLNQLDEIKTANIWCRDVSIDRQDINNLLMIIQTELLNNNIQGIIELHLQDREINSPHIQFIGTEAEKAEYIIATILVNLKYETSIENAIGKKSDFKPYYEINDKFRTQNLDDELEYRENIKKRKEEQKFELDKLDDLIIKFEEEMQKNKSLLEKSKNVKNNFWNKLEKLKEYKNRIRNKNHNIKRIRRKIRRR